MKRPKGKIMDRLSLRNSVVILALLTSALYGCSSSYVSVAEKPEAPKKRFLASVTEEIDAGAPQIKATVSGDDFTALLNRVGKKAYYGNFHAHHFMDAKGSKKNPITLAEVLSPGECRAKKASFPEDDGRPCRDITGADGVVQEGMTVTPRAPLPDGSPDVIDYFKQACEYGTSEGALDINFITPHTKNNQEDEGQIAASSREEHLLARAALLKSMNPAQNAMATRYCGMGQEASSISAGNHINIFGQFKIRTASPKPLFFHSGAFSELYPAIGARISKGEKIILQMNHPGVRADLWFGDLSTPAVKKRSKADRENGVFSRLKEQVNDYGIDDFAPIGCMLGKITGDDCKEVTEKTLTPDALRATYANIRKISRDPFRMIEVIPPSKGDGPEGESSDDADPTDGTTAANEKFGATTNTKTTFRRVHDRTDANTLEDGVYDWIYYLSMGFKLAPSANQDNHFMNYGSATASRTGVIAADLTEAKVLSAMNSRRTFATEDVNARALIFGQMAKQKALMGDALKTVSRSMRLTIAYQDKDAADAEAEVRLYYYRATDPLDFGYRAKTANVFHTVGWSASKTENYRALLPAPGAEGRTPDDLIPIRSGVSVRVNVPLDKGMQWMFVEIIQKGDHDKIWTAPIWIDRN